jgi:hypothetical protein
MSHCLPSLRPRSIRRAERYRYKASVVYAKTICASMLWTYRARAAKRYRVGPHFLRGKSGYQLFCFLYVDRNEPDDLPF